MKKIGFMVQVITLIAALPLLTIMELSHVPKKTSAKNTSEYVNASKAKKANHNHEVLTGSITSAI
ncbi:MAG: hypothetical protein ABIN94_18985 [Ferruginibacter sp.]